MINPPRSPCIASKSWRPCRVCADGLWPCRSRRNPSSRRSLRRDAQVADFRAPDLVLAGEAVDVEAGAANPTALHHGSTPPGTLHVPGQIHAANSTAKDKGFNLFR